MKKRTTGCFRFQERTKAKSQKQKLLQQFWSISKFESLTYEEEFAGNWLLC